MVNVKTNKCRVPLTDWDENDRVSIRITANRQETIIYQITPKSIYTLQRGTGVSQKICDGSYNYFNGFHEIGGDTLILINNITDTHKPFIDIIYNVSDPLRRKRRTSVLTAPTVGHFETVIMQDLMEEELTVFGYMRENTHLHINQYLIKMIDNFYANMTLVIFTKQGLDCGIIAFYTVSIDELLDPAEAIKINENWKQKYNSTQNKHIIIGEKYINNISKIC